MFSSTPFSIAEFARGSQACERVEFLKALNVALKYVTGEALDEEDFQGQNEVLIAGCQSIVSAAVKVRAGQTEFLRDLTNIKVPQALALQIWQVYIVTVPISCPHFLR
jgi:hypothetical protein